ncbi:MAG: hypothetical protein LBU14_04795 [Candidatus Peribacteria bacterium]|nr:hypothetical protein [Candidatus Peribacteria bacterium]
MNCELVEIDGEDLKNLKGENYLGDYKAFSLLITDDSLDYKALYNENVSFVYNRDNFLWSKFFVFPEATKNNYFSFYDVIEDFTTLKFKDLSVFEDDDYEAYYPDNYYNFYA